MQCKRTRQPYPHMIRELEGSFVSASSAWRPLSDASTNSDEATSSRQEDTEDTQASSNKSEEPETRIHPCTSENERSDVIDEGNTADSMALLATTLLATKGIRDAMSRSRWPLAYAMINQEGDIEQFLWNRKSADIGLEGLRVETMHKFPMCETATSDQGSSQISKEVVLTWQGERWTPQSEQQDP